MGKVRKFRTAGDDRIKYALAIGLAAWSLLFTGCASGPDPRDILNKSHGAMTEVRTYRFSGKFETETQDGVIGGRQSGEWSAPDRCHIKFEPTGEFAGQVQETLAVDQRLFTRDSDSRGGAWQEVTPVPQDLAIYSPSPELYLTIPDLENLRLQDGVDVNGMATFQIIGVQRETRTLPPRFPPRPEGDEVEWVTTYTWVIARDDYLLMRYVIEQDTGLGRATNRNTWDFYDYNEPVTVEVPEVAGE
jgi:hypothetical protein